MRGTLLTRQGLVVAQPRLWTPLAIPNGFSIHWAEGGRFVRNGKPSDGVAIPLAWDSEVVPDSTAAANNQGSFWDLNQGTAGSRAVYRASVAALGGRPALDFAGSRFHTHNTFSTALTQPMTVISVAAFTTWTEGTTQTLHDGSAGSRIALLTLTTPTPDTRWIFSGAGTVGGGNMDTGAHLYIAEYNTTASQLIMDGVTIASGSTGTNTLVRLRIGTDSTSAAFFNGHAAFLGIWNRLLTQREKELALRWSRRWYRTP